MIPHSILLLTTDNQWSLLLYEHLAQNGFAPLTVVPTAESALVLLRQIAPSLVLIDTSLLDCNVLDLCTAMLLIQPTVKLILITETTIETPASNLAPQISGSISRDIPLAAWSGLLMFVLQGGKAFSQNLIETALAKARVVQSQQTSLAIGALHIDIAQRTVTYAGERIFVTAREFSLLAYLAHNADRVISIDQLLSEAWGYNTDNGTPAHVRLYITRLRRKLLAHAHIPDFIYTIRGQGYRFDSAALR